MDSSQKSSTIIFSHGFGVEKDARGLFSAIAAALPNANPILFDYNIPDRKENTLTVRPLREQATLLLTEIAQSKERFPDTPIDIIAHSLGCIVTALAAPKQIHRTLFLAPPLEIKSASLDRFADRPGSVINLEGLSRLARRDGSFTLVPAEFWRERSAIDPITLFNTFADQTELTILQAEQDEVVGAGDLSRISEKVQLIALPGDHDFRGDSRQELIEEIKKILT